MSFINRAKLRRLIPAGVVAAAIAVAYMAPLPAEASKTNNCGVKGGYAYGGYAFAFHDHGKPCPNRPFPGKGKGVLKFLVTGITPAATTTQATAKSHKSSHGEGATTVSANDETTAAAVTQVTQSPGKSHGHGKGHGQGNSDLDV